jgi:hypothetical protein
VLVCCLAVLLDRAAGPGRYRRFRNDGSIARGVALGVLGAVGVLGLEFLALALDLDDRLPDEALYGLAALPFLLVAALQWPGVPRIASVLVVAAGTVLAVGHAEDLFRAAIAQAGGVTTVQPARPTSLAGRMAAAGYPERPWTADVPGHSPVNAGIGQLGGMYTTHGSEQSPYRGFMITALPVEAVPGDDPCAAPTFPGPSGVLAVRSCAEIAPGVWLRTGEPDPAMNVPGGTDVLQQRDGRWVAVSADPDIPVTLLRTALAGAAPMTDDELDEWLELVGIPG